MKTMIGYRHSTVGAAFLSTLIVASLLLLFPMKAHSADSCNPAVASLDGNGTKSWRILAGQTIEAGNVTAKLSGSNLEVTFSTIDGWQLSEAHLWVGQGISNLPQTRTGNPIPGQFPYKSGTLNGATSTTFYIPLNSTGLNFSCPSNDVEYLMAAHASVRKPNGSGGYQTETGWSEGSPITSKGNWATVSTLTMTCKCVAVGPSKCETAFAKDMINSGKSVCFLNLGFDRWGWTNGPYTAGTYTMQIYGGAGQCDLSKGFGASVGTLTVNYDGAVATGTFQVNNGFWMEETHLYIGSTQLPKFKQGKVLSDTVAPGQYPFI
ncbi:MAG TPA: hypothetical protein VIS30_02205, partial [Candidatus Deferrimicrobiaceae bacterium]